MMEKRIAQPGIGAVVPEPPRTRRRHPGEEGITIEETAEEEEASIDTKHPGKDMETGTEEVKN